MFILLYRIIKFSFQDIARNIWLSLVTLTILILTLFSINVLLVVQAVSNAAVESVKEKIDINLFLNTESEDDEIMALKTKLENMGEVKSVIYLSQTEALASFESQHEDNPELMDALKELGSNPLSPTLVIKLNNSNEYNNLISKINNLDDDIIESKNFDDHEKILEKINAITGRINDAGLIVIMIFIAITLLLVFNSIRVAIYTHKKEIGIMRLVGASHFFIRAPYLVSGVIYALMGVLIVAGLMYPFLHLLQLSFILNQYSKLG